MLDRNSSISNIFSETLGENIHKLKFARDMKNNLYMNKNSMRIAKSETLRLLFIVKYLHVQTFLRCSLYL